MRSLKVLIGCEYSGTVRNAFLAEGHDAWSCDLVASDDGSNRHIIDDIRNVLTMDNWDMLLVAHPPCTRLCNSGVRWLTEPPPNPQPGYPSNWRDMSREEKLDWLWMELEHGADLFSHVWNADIPHIAVENPIMHKHAKARIVNYEPFAQSAHPWHFGTDEDGPDNVKKRTCLWLRNLPKLVHTGTLDGSTARAEIHEASPSPTRGHDRAKFFPGFATAMAQQWGEYVDAYQDAA